MCAWFGRRTGCALERDHQPRARGQRGAPAHYAWELEFSIYTKAIWSDDVHRNVFFKVSYFLEFVLLPSAINLFLAAWFDSSLITNGTLSPLARSKFFLEKYFARLKLPESKLRSQVPARLAGAQEA